nr:hypothetical protein [Tanacetum cinerariifolium]
MTGDRSLLRNFIEKFMGTVFFGNDNFAAIIGYGDYTYGNKTIYHVYYIEGLGHNLFSVKQFYDGGCESNLYTIFISDIAASSPVCLMSKATSTKSWLWHRRLPHLNFGTINDLTGLDLVDGLPKLKYKGSPMFCMRNGQKQESFSSNKIGFNHNSSAEPMNIPSKEDLDNLFGLMFEEYFGKKSSDTPINFATQPTQLHEDSPSTSSISIDEHEAPLIKTTSDEQTSPISLTEADELHQDDSTDFDGNS